LQEYVDWFTKAGFTDVQIKRIGPSWYRGVRRHGLIMGCSVTGRKVSPGESPLKLGPKVEAKEVSPTHDEHISAHDEPMPYPRDGGVLQNIFSGMLLRVVISDHRDPVNGLDNLTTSSL
jgi:hypothetical protein